MQLDYFNPFGNIFISAAIACIPIIIFLIGLTLLKLKGYNAAGLTAIVSLVLAIFAFKLPVEAVLPSIVQGFVQGMWPIGYIIIMAVWLYRLTLASGQFETIKTSLIMTTKDHRFMVLLIGFCFGGFLEAAVGFGVPIAICSVMLIGLGFPPLKAAMLCLIANIAVGSMGAVGIPIVIVDSLRLEGVNAKNVAQATNLTLPFIYFSVPFLLVFLLDGIRGIKETLPAILVTSIVFTTLQVSIMQFLGPELAALCASLSTLAALAFLAHNWQPARIFRINANSEQTPSQPEVDTEENLPSYGTIFKAWAPFSVLSAFMILWGMPFFKALFKTDAPFAFTNLSFQLLETTPSGAPITLNISLVSVVGTAIFITIILTIIGTGIRPKEALKELKTTIKSFWLSVLTVCLVLVVAKLMTYSGMTVALGQAAAATGKFFPLFSPILGWIGVFMTGSVVNNNILFAPVQTTAANVLGISAPILVATNTVGGAIAKMVSPASIVVASATIGKTGQESAILKLVLKYSFIYLFITCLWIFALSQFFF